MTTDFGRRFDDLCKQAEQIDASKKLHVSSNNFSIDSSAFLNWKVKVRHLLTTVCGPDSQHFTQFVKNEEVSMYTTNYQIFLKLQAVLLAAKDDYEGGYLNKLKHLVQSEVFDSELEQAQELFDSGYITAAAVIAGVVLETGLREMCGEMGIAIGTMDKMNADLAKAGFYNKLVQKQITALAAVRNSAAHGKPGEFTKDDVASMIKEATRILANRAM